MEQRGFFSLSEHLEKLSEHGDPLEVLDATVDFEYFRGWLVEGLGYSDGSKGGRPPFDPVSMFKALILQAQHNLSDAKMEFMIRDRLSWMRFLGRDLGGPTPDENTIRLFRNKLAETGTLKRVMKAFDWQLHKKGYIPMAGQIVDASLVPAPKQRNTEDEKAAIKAGKSAADIWPDKPNKAAQKDTQARWTLKIGGKIRYRPDGTPLPQIALPVFGYKSHIVIDRRYGFIRESAVTSASEADGRMLRRLVTTLRRSGPTQPTARGRTKNGWLLTCSPAASIAASQRVSRCPRRPRVPMARNLPYAPASSMSLPIKRCASACSSAPLGWRGPRPN
jgi:IS5 family transposase